VRYPGVGEETRGATRSGTADHRFPRERADEEEVRAQRAERLLVLHDGQHGRDCPSPEQEPEVRSEGIEVRRRRSQRVDPPADARTMETGGLTGRAGNPAWITA